MESQQYPSQDEIESFKENMMKQKELNKRENHPNFEFMPQNDVPAREQKDFWRAIKTKWLKIIDETDSRITND